MRAEAVGFELALLLAGAALAGVLHLGGLPTAEALLLVLAAYLLRHLYLLWRLARFIQRQHRLAPPFPLGLWGELYRAVGRYQQRSRKGRKRQLRFQRRFREAANSVPDALVVLGKSQRIEWANPAAAEMLGVRWPDHEGRLLTEVCAQTGLGTYLEADEYARPLEVPAEHDQSIMLSIRVAPFGERKRQRLVVGRDITKIFHLNMIRRDFVANASHELRTPLTVIAGFVENLASSALTPEPHRRPLSLMENQTNRMRSIIEDLLTLSRLELEDAASNLTPVNLPQEIEQVVADARTLSAGKHDITLDLDHDLMLIGNQSELRSAVSNLVFNAVKHTPAGSHVRVWWQDEPVGPVLRVADDGPGIAPEHIPRITERFYRVDKARSRASGGTGLGLAIVKHVLSHHDAVLSIASEPGRGATFTCRFPAESRLRRTDQVPQLQVLRSG
ncbi:phosphate regulon sensor histidine kinase PhoR [uncultured Thiohalocapsa sp.]|uniref:phosphate regulon sensor histidine kinase PhoR n=1 Tax=uncultured Thiohalocapsa sp. TaxID=768990 RepID=UPI0025F6EE67|nr:phosphate regulon sensor histidine kinase PhoR [uncultured Thiohalocapsa sp.]